jgi:hypothetical protein
MSRPIFHIGNQRAITFLGFPCLFSHALYKTIKKLDVFPFVFTANIVVSAYISGPHNSPYPRIMILDINPIPDVLAISVNGEGLVFEHIEDHKRNELLRELEGTVVI